MISKGMALTRHLLDDQQESPGGNLGALLIHIGLAAKLISRELNRAALVGMLGNTGEVNVQGEQVKQLDMWSNDVFVNALKESRLVCTVVSEEMAEPLHFDRNCGAGRYVVCFDPVDGSSNVDSNVTIGTIFSVRRRRGQGRDHVSADVLQKGNEQVAAGYVMYGPSTVLVYTAGRGVHGFTLDQTIGEYILSHPTIRIPTRGKIYSVNQGNYHRWHQETRRAIDYLNTPDKATGRPYSLRYVGSMVADMHRTLLEGGIFMYPAEAGEGKKSTGKLRLLYEAAPMGYVVEQAGGRASTGTERILDIEPSDCHQRVPLFIGSADDVALVEEFCLGKR
ncbi:MAG: class 1 fructose-bisphosphatase [Candidatus Methylomirabilis sp.]